LPLEIFYRELLAAQRAIYSKRLNVWTVPIVAKLLTKNLLRGQTNFLRGIMKFNRRFDVELLMSDHARPITYELPLPPRAAKDIPNLKANQLFIHAHRGRPGRSIDDSTEGFVEATRMGAPPG
jgi:hypothetical protein